MVRDIILTANTTFIRDYVDASEVFSNVSSAGGVCYFLKDKSYSGECSIYNGHDKWKTTLNNGYFIRQKIVSDIHDSQ